MRNDPFLGQFIKPKEMDMIGIDEMESGKYDRERYDDRFKTNPSSAPFSPRVT
jgi:hypothetical protein